MTRETIEQLTCTLRDKVTARDVYGRILDPGNPHRSKTTDQRMDIVFDSIEKHGMEVVGFGYPTMQEKFLLSDLESVWSGDSYIRNNLQYPRLIVRPKPPKKYRYITDNIERYPKEGDYFLSLGDIKEYNSKIHDNEPRLCFTREEVTD